MNERRLAGAWCAIEEVPAAMRDALDGHACDECTSTSYVVGSVLTALVIPLLAGKKVPRIVQHAFGDTGIEDNASH